MKKLFVSAFAVFACLLSFNLSAQECTGLSLDWSAFTHYQVNSFYVTNNEDYDPVLMMQFYQDEETGAITAGTYDLGSTTNSSYATCTECVFLQADLVGEGENASYSKIYYQKSGELKIDAVDASNEIKGTITAVLAEATIDDDTLATDFVTDGACFEIESAAFDSGVCVPDCTGKICGDDGCGGTCGDGCGDLACSEDQTSCVEYECSKITLNNNPEYEGDLEYNFYSYNFHHTPAVANGDYTTFELYDAIEAGEYDLADTNYADCTVCMQLFEEIEYDDEGNMTGIGRRYFQKSGKVNVTSFNDANGAISASFNKVRLVEVTVDSNWTSSEVAGGKCYDIEDAPFTYSEGTEPTTDPTTEPTTDPTTEPTTDPTAEPTDGNNDDTNTGDTDQPNEEDSQNTEKEDKDSSGCSLVTL